MIKQPPESLRVKIKRVNRSKHKLNYHADYAGASSCSANVLLMASKNPKQGLKQR
jgi:hypothetical protein